MSALAPTPTARAVGRASFLRANAFVALKRQGALPPLGALVVFFVVYAIINPDLFTRFQLQTVANLVAPLACIALAELLIVLVGGIDISVGAAMSLANVVFATQLEHGVARAFVLCFLTGIACGAFNGVLVAYVRLPTIATTLASTFVFGALANEVLDRPGGVVPTSVTNAVAGEVAPYVPAALVWVLAAGVLLWLVLQKTAIGRQVYGVGSNAAGVEAAGLSARRAQLAAFLIGGALIALAAIMLAGSTATGDPKSGDPYLLNAVAAVALGGALFRGGVGSVTGTLAAATILGLIGNVLFFANVNSYWQYVVGSVIIVLVVGLPVAWRIGRARIKEARS
jgi:ribose transport system permease protein